MVCLAWWAVPVACGKLHPAVFCPNPKPFKHAWRKIGPIFVNLICFSVLMIGGASAWHGGWNPCSCSLWKLHPAVSSPSLKPFKHVWRTIGPISLHNTLFWVFMIGGASAWHGEPADPAVVSKPQNLQTCLAQNRSFFLKIGC